MKALVLVKENSLPEYTEVKFLNDSSKKVVQVRSAALNHRDIWIFKGKYAGIKLPVILGSDAAGEIDRRPVIIQPGMYWGDSESYQSKSYQILGMPSNGSFAELLQVDERQIFDKPAHLDFNQAAALPLAGLTAFRVLFKRCAAKKGETVLITGIGGGVALFCLQFAVAAGLKVFVTSGSDEKIEKAINIGASGGVNYKDKIWPEVLRREVEGFDVIIDSAAGTNFSSLVKLANFGGRIGIYGGTDGVIAELSPQLLFWKQLSILGSTMGSENDFREMLQFVNDNQIIPIIDTIFSIENGEEAFRRLDSGNHFGKVILKVL